MVERKTGVPDLLPATKPGVRTYQEAERLLFFVLMNARQPKRSLSASFFVFDKNNLPTL